MEQTKKTKKGIPKYENSFTPQPAGWLILSTWNRLLKCWQIEDTKKVDLFLLLIFQKCQQFFFCLFLIHSLLMKLVTIMGFWLIPLTTNYQQHKFCLWFKSNSKSNSNKIQNMFNYCKIQLKKQNKTTKTKIKNKTTTKHFCLQDHNYAIR